MKQSDSTVRRTHTNERIVTSRPAVVLLQSSVIPTRVTCSLPLLFKFREMLLTVIRSRGTCTSFHDVLRYAREKCISSTHGQHFKFSI